MQGELWGWTCFYAAVTSVGFGSSYYHLGPNDNGLVWDRLPVSSSYGSWLSHYFFFLFILVWQFWFLNFCLLLEMSVAFASLMAILIIERIDVKIGTISIFPLIMAAMISSVYWRQAQFFVSFTWTEFFSLITIFLHSLMQILYSMWAKLFFIQIKVCYFC